MTLHRLLCEHAAETAHRASYRLVCGVCNSFVDVESSEAAVTYDAAYPADRGHFDPHIANLKVRTLERWLAVGGVSLESKKVCEVGFGGGSCLSFLAGRASRVVGVEANPAVIEHARQVGIDAELLLADALPAHLTSTIDLWVFQDSFEHIPDPGPFVDWMAANSAAGAEILLVAPRADSMSRRLMGRHWLHKLPDHTFHWSRAGLVEFMKKRGFHSRASFFPLKFISPAMAVAHLRHKAGLGTSRRAADGRRETVIPFNFGEMGLVFKRHG